MKTLKVIFIIATVILAMSGCRKTNLNADCSESEIIFEATTFRGDETKTARKEDGTIWWTEKDEINIFCGDASGLFVSQNEEPSAKTTFAGSFDMPVTTEDISSKGVVAFYPYSEDVTFNGDEVSFVLPSVQTALEDTFDDDLYPAIAKSNNTELSFYNICGGIKFTVSRDDIKSITFKGNNSEQLAGKVNVRFDENYTPEIDIVQGESAVLVTAPDGGNFKVGKSYYIVMLPQELNNGFTLIYNENMDVICNSFVTNKPVAIHRSKFGVLKELDETLSMIDSNDPIVFADEVMKEMCINAFDSNGDGELSYKEAAAVRYLSRMTLTKKTFKTFDEFQYFTGVTEIPRDYFAYSTLTSIVLPPNIKTIGYSAFKECGLLQQIVIPSSTINIGRYAFENCVSLSYADINADYIDYNAFNGCKNLKIVRLHKSAYYAGYVFSGCPIEDVYVDDLESWLSSSFEEGHGGVSPLESGADLYVNGDLCTEVLIPDKITKIAFGCFSGCKSIKCVELHDGITLVDDRAFRRCENLESINIPESVMTIGEYAFYESGLSKIVIPESVIFIGVGAFDSCRQLKEIVFPNTINQIDLNGCTSLVDINIPNSVTSVSLSNCTSLTSISLPNGVTDVRFYSCTSLAEVILPESVADIGDYAFYNCGSLMTIVIPDKVTSIGNSAFRDCSCLIDVTLSKAITNLSFASAKMM